MVATQEKQHDTPEHQKSSTSDLEQAKGNNNKSDDGLKNPNDEITVTKGQRCTVKGYEGMAKSSGVVDTDPPLCTGGSIFRISLSHDSDV